LPKIQNPRANQTPQGGKRNGGKLDKPDEPGQPGDLRGANAAILPILMASPPAAHVEETGDCPALAHRSLVQSPSGRSSDKIGLLPAAV